MTSTVEIPNPTRSIEEAMERIASTDLEMVRFKLADGVGGRAWNEGELDLAEREYRRFLALNLMFPELDIVGWSTKCGTVISSTRVHMRKTPSACLANFCTTSPTSGCVMSRMQPTCMTPTTRRWRCIERSSAIYQKESGGRPR